MKFYSEVTKQLYDNEKDLIKAEEKIAAEEQAKKAKDAEKGKRAKEVEAAYKASVEAQNKFNELKNKFIEDYGSFHMTYTEKKPAVKASENSITDIFDYLFGIL